MKQFVSLEFLIFRQSVGLLGWRMSLTQGRYLYRTTQTELTQASMPWVGFEPTIPMLKRVKTFNALKGTATVIGKGLKGKSKAIPATGRGGP
jgi:hypothetical protein